MIWRGVLDRNVEDEILYEGESEKKRKRIDYDEQKVEELTNPTISVFKTNVLSILSDIVKLQTEAEKDCYKIPPCGKKDCIERIMQHLCKTLLFLAGGLKMSLVLMINEKLLLNRQKYPVKPCETLEGDVSECVRWARKECDKDSLDDYHMKAAMEGNSASGSHPYFHMIRTFEESYATLLVQVCVFREVRGFKMELKDIFLALINEYGELCETVTWMDESRKMNDLDCDLKQKIVKEIADVAIYSLHLCSMYKVYMPPDGVLRIDVPFGGAAGSAVSKKICVSGGK